MTWLHELGSGAWTALGGAAAIALATCIWKALRYLRQMVNLLGDLGEVVTTQDDHSRTLVEHEARIGVLEKAQVVVNVQPNATIAPTGEPA